MNAPVIDPACCPLCGGPNDCQLCLPSVRSAPCWCRQEEFPAGLLACVPEPLRNRACICRSCLTQFRQDQPVVQARPARAAHRAPAFTLIELLVVMALIAILSALLLPVLARGKGSAQKVACESNLRQLGIAAHLYWDDSGGKCFKVSDGTTNGGTTWWFGWLDSSQPEGRRPFDLSAGKLAPYLSDSDVRLCPALDGRAPRFKLKATNVVFSYGYNGFLSPGQPPLTVSKIRTPADTALFADAAQVNDFQPPAAHDNPMLEEWYFLDNPTNYPGPRYYPHGHFRHAQKANAAFCDGHAGPEMMVPGSQDPRLADQYVGRLRPEILIVP
jgi:prepilin-type N-terminal cleavage/methylation domain-containing protein/prepilin-type processing-associated H-X9-DG protein